MSTFTPKEVTPYKKLPPPNDEQSHRYWIDTEFRHIERNTLSTHSGIEQLQAEMDLIWTALAALGHPRP